jgi:predicted component of type VI protein secretion system
MQNHFRVRLGPIDAGMFQQFLPAATIGDTAVPPPLLRMVRDLARFYAPAGLGFDIQLEISGTAIPAPILKRDAPVLGQSIWLSARNPDHTVDDVILSGELSA